MTGRCFAIGSDDVADRDGVLGLNWMSIINTTHVYREGKVLYEVEYKTGDQTTK